MLQGPGKLLCRTRHSQDQLSNWEGRKYSCSWNKSVCQAHGLQPITGQQATRVSSCEWSFWLHGAWRSQVTKHPDFQLGVPWMVKTANGRPCCAPVTFLVWLLLNFPPPRVSYFATVTGWCYGWRRPSNTKFPWVRGAGSGYELGDVVEGGEVQQWCLTEKAKPHTSSYPTGYKGRSNFRLMFNHE